MSSLLSFKQPARVSIDNSDSPVSKEDIQSSSPSLQDSEKVCGFSESWYRKQKPISVHVHFFSFYFVFSSRKTVEQKQGSAVKTLMVQWDYQTMWVRSYHTAFAAELNELWLSGSGILYVQLAFVSPLPNLGQGCGGNNFMEVQTWILWEGLGLINAVVFKIMDSFVASKTNI